MSIRSLVIAGAAATVLLPSGALAALPPWTVSSPADVKTSASVVTANGHAVFLPTATSGKLVSVSADGKALTRKANFKPIAASAVGTDRFWAFGTTPAGRSVLTWGRAGSGALYTRTLPKSAGLALSHAANSSGDFVIAGGPNFIPRKTVGVWVARKGGAFKKVLTLGGKHAALRPAVAISQDRKRVLVAWQQNRDVLVRTGSLSGKWGKVQKLQANSGVAQIHAAIQPDGRQLVVWRSSWSGLDTAGQGPLYLATAGNGQSKFGAVQTVEPGIQGGFDHILLRAGASGTVLAWDSVSTGAEQGVDSRVVRAALVTGGVAGAPQDVTPPGVNPELRAAEVRPGGDVTVVWSALPIGADVTNGSRGCLYSGVVAQGQTEPSQDPARLNKECDLSWSPWQPLGVGFANGGAQPVVAYHVPDGTARVARR